MEFSTQISIRFDEADPAGILFFGNSFHLAHRVVEDFVMHLGLEWRDWFENPDWAVPICHAEADFKKPLYAGNHYTANLKISKLGNSSVKFNVKISGQAGTCATISTTHVFTAIDEMKSCPIPEDIRKLLAPYQVD